MQVYKVYPTTRDGQISKEFYCVIKLHDTVFVVFVGEVVTRLEESIDETS